MQSELTAIWRDEPLKYPGNLVIWGEQLRTLPGSPRNPSNGRAAEKFMARVRAEYGPLPPAPYSPSQPLRMGKEARAWLKRTCPRNYETMVKLYGKQDPIDPKPCRSHRHDARICRPSVRKPS